MRLKISSISQYFKQATLYQGGFSRAGVLLFLIGIFLGIISFVKGIQILMFIPAFILSLFVSAIYEYLSISKSLNIEIQRNKSGDILKIFNKKDKKFTFIFAYKSKNGNITFIKPDKSQTLQKPDDEIVQIIVYVFGRFDIIRKRYFFPYRSLQNHQTSDQYTISEKITQGDILERVDALKTSLYQIPFIKKDIESAAGENKDGNIIISSNKSMQNRNKKKIFFLHILLILIGTIGFIIEWMDLLLASFLLLSLGIGIIYGKQKYELSEKKYHIFAGIAFICMLALSAFYRDMSGAGSVFLLQLLLLTSLTQKGKTQSFLFIFLTLFVFVAISLFSSQIRFILLFLGYLGISTYLLFFISGNETYEKHDYKFGHVFQTKDIIKAIGGIIFGIILFYFLLPHGDTTASPLGSPQKQNNETTTGFSEEISFENIGAISQDNQKIFAIENTTLEELYRNKLHYFRGARYHYFDGVKWKNTSTKTYLGYLPKYKGVKESFQKKFHYYLDGGNNIFIPTLPVNITDDNDTMFYHPYGDATLLKTQNKVNKSIHLDFTFQTQSGKIVSYDPYQKDFTLQTSPQTTKIFEKFFSQIPEEVKTPKDYEKYIRLQAGLSYSIDKPAKDFNDFLYGSKQGHCEYFATLLTLSLQNAGYKATLVTGFRDGEYNPLAQSVIVRAKHAHAWTELYDEETKSWIILDATPPDLGINTGFDYKLYTAKVRELYDFIDLKWYAYVVSYTAEEQKALFRFLAQNSIFIAVIVFLLFGIKKLGSSSMRIFNFFQLNKKEKYIYLISKFIQEAHFPLKKLKKYDENLAQKYEKFLYFQSENISWIELMKDLKTLSGLLKK